MLTNIQDIPRTYTALAECLGCLIYIVLLPRKDRARGWKVFPAVLVFLVCQSAFLVLTRHTRGVLWVLCMLAAFALMYAFLFSCLDMDNLDILYRTAKAVLIAEAAASLEWQISSWFLWYTGIRPWYREIILLVLIYGGFFFMGGHLEYRILKDRSPVRMTGMDVIMACLVTVLTFALSNLSFYAPGSPFSSPDENGIFIIRTLVDLVGMGIMFGLTSRLYDLAAERELSEIRSLFKSHYDSYRSYQDSLDLINMKYHDLKHQLDGLRGEEDPERRREWIEAMEKELTAYKPKYLTGSPVLDAILDGKQVRMQNAGINFTCVADGSLLDFLHVTDICTIFGNALDNAVEAAASVPERDRRLVHLSVSSKRSFLLIYVGNSCTVRPSLEDGLPVTTKKDRRLHGYGVKSIRMAVRKYQGTLSFQPGDGQFDLQIMIPLPEAGT